MKKREVLKLGIPLGPAIKAALAACGAAADAGWSKQQIRDALRDLARAPESFVDHALLGPVAAHLVRRTPLQDSYALRADLEYAVWGADIDAAAHEQMRNACRLPVSVAAALMPDAHLGYGLPIGGVLATVDAVIPYAVGVDIACRVKMTVFDLSPDVLRQNEHKYAGILERDTKFGVGAGWRGGERPDHPVMDDDWRVTPLTDRLKDLAWKQLGTSGSGNHFVEFGVVEFGAGGTGVSPVGEERGPARSTEQARAPAVHAPAAPARAHPGDARGPNPSRLPLPGRYLAVVSHSGSRGTGAQTCSYYSRVARELHPNLPQELRYLAWLPLDGDGAEYWAAMELMGHYASANHAVIHDKIIRSVGAPVLYQIENHHNFAWKETHGGRELIVHRKGATPAGAGVLGYIPGSMTAPGYLVEGRGDPRSLDSASHGAGRRMSRTQARRVTTWPDLKAYLAEQGVRLLSAGLDEAPQAYKNIDEVMQAQQELVRRVAKFTPKLVKMAPEGERPED